MYHSVGSLMCFIYLSIVLVLFKPVSGGIPDNPESLSEIPSNVIVWSFETDGPIMGSALVDNGIVYIGSRDSYLYAIDAATGSEIWHYKSGNQIFTTPVKLDTIICFESGNILYGVNLQGELSWSFQLYDGPVQNMHDEWDYYHSSPLVVEDTVYIGTEKGHVFGVNGRNGSEVFHCQTPGAGYTIETTPAVFNNKIYFGDWDGVFYAYNLSSETLVWQYDTKNDGTYSGWVNAIVTDPVIHDGSVFFGGRNCKFYCLDTETGEKHWMYKDPNDMWIIGGPTLADSILYVGSSYQQVAHAFNANSGELLWKKSVVHRANGKAMADGDLVYIGTQSTSDINIGTLCALNKSDGNLKTNLNLGTQIYSTPVLADGIIYLGGYNGRVYAIHKDNYDSIVYPKTYNTIPSPLNLGTFGSKGLYDSTFYFYNEGQAADSVAISDKFRQKEITVTIDPANFCIAAQDSKEVRILIQFDSLKTGSYRGTLYINSSYALIPGTHQKSITFKVDATSIKNRENNQPRKYNLEQNYPNPFNNCTMINYQIPTSGEVELSVYNLLGQKLKSLVSAWQPAGNHQVRFDMSGFASGIYIYQIHSGSFPATKKMALLK
ncbi:MAG: PQQ-binding-like beta-propeller repeat protein [Calditrichaceae bacterium]|nr:PQQ-binding-like beta-propeller repeat protein [Calditrichaceae bacterium]MBN2708796.1 PQQ-binding-like beta-propeller repeat protein [Calditrichaceae bacterium]RQV97674.1 MAG: T9SS C-terminal target domain-containing protein [Calditrichota bacterium]